MERLKAAISQSRIYMRTEWFLGPGLLKINGDREMNL